MSFCLIWWRTSLSMNIFILHNVLDTYGPTYTPKMSNWSRVPILQSHVIACGWFISHFILWPDPIVTTVIDSYLHHHQLSQAHLWWRPQLVSWLQIAVIGWAGNVEMQSVPSQGSVNNNPDQLGGMYCVKWFRAPDCLCGSAVVVTYICRPVCPKLSPQSCQLHTLRWEILSIPYMYLEAHQFL